MLPIGFGRRRSGLNRLRPLLEDFAGPDDLARIHPLPRILSGIIVPLPIGSRLVQVRGHPIAQGSQDCGDDKKHCAKKP